MRLFDRLYRGYASAYAMAHRAARIAARRSIHIATGFTVLALSSISAFDASAQAVDIATSPLYAGATPSANVAITASLEFPTAGQAYIGVAYVPTNVYVGYFDPTKCYKYNTSLPVGALSQPLLQADYYGHFNEGDPNGYFYVFGAAVNHVCASPLASGNVMNWATMAAIDEFRYALTGGNRVLEAGPNGGTILQRAYLTGCSPTVPYTTNCVFDLANSAVPGVYDFYNAPGLYPQLGPINLSTGAPGLTYINNCKTYMYLSGNPIAGNIGNCTYPVADQGVYNIRINVCDSAEGPVRSDLCLQYGSSGKYKPVGQVQLNASKMRFAMFSYLSDRSISGYTVPANCRDNYYGGDPWNRCRAGGVLRSPMKYVGPTTFDANGAASVNVNAEINTDGTLVDDPEGNASSFGGKYSGFINYLNRFGSVVQANPPGGSLGGAGEYKRYDPISELYYEAVRYYQNLPPTPQTYQDQGVYTTTAARNQIAGYFPVLSGATWPADPIVQQCAANFIISIGDTNTWDDVNIPGYAGSPAQIAQSAAGGASLFRPTARAVSGGLDAYAWTKKVGMLEATTSSLTANDVRPVMYATDGNPFPVAATTIQDTVTGSPNGAILGTATYFAAGVAYWANTNEVRPDLPALPNGQLHTIKTISVDTGGQVRPVWDRQLYLMGKYGGFTVPTVARSDGTQLNPFYATNPLNPTGPGIRSNSEWESTPGSGYPANYLRSTSPQVLIAGLQTAFASISANSGTASGAALTSASLNYGAAGTYLAQFSPARWSGTVLNETVSSVNNQFTVNTTPVWDSGALLTTRCGTSTVCTDTDTSVNRRNIVTTITTSGVRSAVNFTFPNLATDTNYLYALNINPSTRLADGLGQQRVNYLRGYRGDESSALAFRPRNSAMGDIINSAPVYVGPPSTGITDTAYQSFFATNVGRTAAVYVGANDGMLHAFNATTGAELFAYIPGLVSSYLSDLTNPGYTHDPYVDAVPTIQEAKVNGAFKTVLVSGTGAGAQGVFALDVTDPMAFDPTKVIFEFSEADDFDLGNVVFAPQIVKLQNGTTTSGGVTTPTYGYFAVVTSYDMRRPLCNSPGNAQLLQVLAGGLGPFFNSIPHCLNNSQGDTYLVQDSANRGILYLLSLDRTVGTPWTLNTNYYKFYFPAISTTSRNGLGPVSALPSSSGDGTTAALYFGDLQGQLWRFNTVGIPSAWGPSRGVINAALPIFVASPSANVYQPITARPELASGPYGSTLVIFGTGAYLGQSDLSTPYATQSEYVLIDTNGTTLINRAANLQPRTATVSGTQVVISGSSYTYSGAGSTGLGWYVDFPSSSSLGERMVNKAAVVPGVLTFTSLTLATGVCGTGGGYVYQVNPITGLPLSGSGTAGGYASTVGIPGPPAIVDLSVASGQQRATGEQINQKTRATIVSGTSGSIQPVGPAITMKVPPVGRVNWREITNYNDRH